MGKGMSEQEWTLVEYRPGRFVKVSPEGDVLGKATESEARAWFARRGWPLTGLRESQRREPPSSEQDEIPERVAPARPQAEEAGEIGPSPREAAGKPSVAPRPVKEATQAPAEDAGSGSMAQAAPKAGAAQPPAPEPEVPAVAVREVEPDSQPAEPTAEGVEPETAAVRPTAEPSEPEGIPQAPDEEAEQRWLWLDPRGDARFGQETFENASFLRLAADRFRVKDWAGGCAPGRLAVHPDLVTPGLEAAAAELGMEIVADPRVMPGTFMFGLAQREEES